MMAVSIPSAEVISFASLGLGAGLGVRYRSSGFNVWTALDIDTDDDLLRLT